MASDPSSIDQPHVYVVLLDLGVEEICVDLRFEGQEGLAEAGGESGGGLFDALLGSCDLSSVA